MYFLNLGKARQGRIQKPLDRKYPKCPPLVDNCRQWGAIFLREVSTGKLLPLQGGPTPIRTSAALTGPNTRPKDPNTKGDNGPTSRSSDFHTHNEEWVHKSTFAHTYTPTQNEYMYF